MCLVTCDISIKPHPEEGSRKRALNTEGDDLTNISVPTFPVERSPQQLDVTSLTSSELSDLKSNDPFMYYSISSVRNATLRGKNVDISLLCAQSKSLQSSSVGRICSKGNVTRQKRVSTECHSDLLYADMFEEYDSISSNKLDMGAPLLSGDDNYLYEDSLIGFLLELNGSR